MKYQTVSSDNSSILTVIIKPVRTVLGYQTKIIYKENVKVLKAVWKDKTDAYKYGTDIVPEFKEIILQ
jgi:hypothetical protein